MPCNDCKLIITSGYLCTVCDDFKLCVWCYNKRGHSHEMKTLTELMSYEGSQYMQLEDKVSTKGYLRTLLHVYRFQESNYKATYASLFEHISSTNRLCNCVICKQMQLIHTYHNKHCQTPGCCISTCPIINEQFLKKCLAESNIQDIMKKSLRGYMVKTNVKDSKDTKKPLFVSLSLSRKFKIQRYIRSLVHASKCLESKCMLQSCKQIKLILSHVKNCRHKVLGRCPICIQVSTLCCFHASTCTDATCTFMLCNKMKYKLKSLKKYVTLYI